VVLEQQDTDIGATLRRVLRAIKKRVLILLLFLLFGLLLSYVFLSVVPPKFKASAQFLFDPSAEQMANPDARAIPSIVNLKALERVIALIQAPGTLRQVAEKLQSDKRIREFQPESAIKKILTDEELSGDGRLRRLITQMGKDLSIKTEAADQIIIAEYQSKSAQEAAYVVNLIVETFIRDRVESRKEASSQASHWFDERFAEAKSNLKSVDQKIQAYKAEHNIDDDAAFVTSDKQLARLHEQLGTVETKLMDADSFYNSLQSNVSGANYDKLAEVLDDPAMEKLRASLSAAEAEMASAKARLGSFHPDVRSKQANVQVIRLEIAAEARRKLLSAKNELQNLQDRQQSLKSNIKSMESRLQDLQGAEAQLRELQAEREAIKTLYESMLTRVMQNPSHQGSNFSEFKLLLDAAVPDRPKISPVIIWAGGAVGGLLMGVLLIVFLEFSTNHLIYLGEVEGHLPAMVLARVPAIREDDFVVDGNKLGGEGSAKYLTFAREFPDSMFTNALINLRLTMRQAMRGAEAKIVMITSPLPGAGKTHLSSNLASLSALLEERTLLINFDTRKIVDEGEVANGVENTVIGAHLHNTQLHRYFTFKKGAAGFDILGLKPTQGSPWLELFRPQMRELLTLARENYDQIWIDTAPTQMFADALILAKQVDGFFIVAEWSKTSKKQVKDTYDVIVRSGGNVIGIIINRIVVDDVVSEYMASYRDYYSKPKEKNAAV
jgi:polysaccharide biosynthesis transport protein